MTLSIASLNMSDDPLNRLLSQVVLYYLGVIIIAGCFVRNLFLAVLFEEFTQLGRVDLAAAAMEKRAAAQDGPAASKKLSQSTAEPGFMERVANSAFLSNCSIALVLVNAIEPPLSCR